MSFAGSALIIGAGGERESAQVQVLYERCRVQPRTYEITFAGQAGTILRAEFDDCDVSVGPGTTTLRAGLLDQGALQGLMQRITGLGLELIEVRVVAPPPAE